MARPYKKVRYYPLDIDFVSDSKIRRLIMNHGAEAVAVYNVLTGRVYGSGGYYMVHDDDVCAELAFVLQLSEEKVKMIIGTCLRLGLYDNEKMEKWGIYTSFGIQIRYDAICSRQAATMDNRYLTARMKAVLDDKRKVLRKKPPVSAEKSGVFASEPPVSAVKTPLKEKGNKKENKSKSKKTKTVNDEEGLQETKAIAGTTGTGMVDGGRLAELQRLFDAATGEQHD